MIEFIADQFKERKKRGRKPGPCFKSRGPRAPYGLREGSIHTQLSQMQVGERIYVETTPEGYAQVQRNWNVPARSRSAATKDIVVECSVWTCIGKNIRDIRYLVCVERIK